MLLIEFEFRLVTPHATNRDMCYYIENQGFGGVTTRDMSLIETC